MQAGRAVPLAGGEVPALGHEQLRLRPPHIVRGGSRAQQGKGVHLSLSPFPRQFEYRSPDTICGTVENAFEKTTTTNVASEPKKVKFVTFTVVLEAITELCGMNKMTCGKVM